MPKIKINPYFLRIKTKKYAFLSIADKGLIRLYLFRASHFWQKSLQNSLHHLFQGENIPEIENPSFLKMTLENLKIPENRIGIYTNTIMRNDAWRNSNILSNRVDARLRPYSAINQRNAIMLLGISIVL